MRTFSSDHVWAPFPARTQLHCQPRPPNHLPKNTDPPFPPFSTLPYVPSALQLDTTLKAAYNKGKYSLDVTADAASRLTVNGSLAEVAQGLKVGGSAVLPDPSSARIWAEYVQGSLAAKTTVGLTASPAVELAVATAVKGILVGGEVGYDTGKSAITKYNIALGRCRRVLLCKACSSEMGLGPEKLALLLRTVPPLLVDPVP